MRALTPATAPRDTVAPAGTAARAEAASQAEAPPRAPGTGPGSSRTADEAERAGRPLVLRAAVAALVGGLVIAGVATDLGPRMLVADVRVLGIGLGALVAALAVGALVSGRVGGSTGPVLVAAGVVALPVAGGGLMVGSVLVLGAGVVLASLQPAPEGAVAVLEPGHRVRRVVAAGLDVALTAAVVLVLSASLLNAAMEASTAAVYAVWAATWLLLTVPVALLTTSSPGAWLVAVRLVTPDGGRPGPAAVVARQALRGAVGVGGLVLAASVAASLGTAPGLLAAAVVAAAAAAVTGWRLVDRATRTVPVTALVRAAG